ncbi:hypothetical protein [Streptomyces sp. NPDC005485]|uniref:hypothetical protein n=1 Tax=Streptomyces sp. NPDC005485 TaxID=3155591 RepID=UPI0033B554E2
MFVLRDGSFAVIGTGFLPVWAPTNREKELIYVPMLERHISEQGQTVRAVVKETSRTVRYIAILLTRALIGSAFSVLAIVGYVVWQRV